MTCLEKISRANRWRIKTGKMGSNETAGFNGAFIVPISGEMWQVIISDGMDFRHLSATNAQRRQLPGWEIMCRLKELFFADDSWVVIYIPAKEAYINDHPYCHHLWEPLNEKLPIPWTALV